MEITTIGGLELNKETLFLFLLFFFSSSPFIIYQPSTIIAHPSTSIAPLSLKQSEF